LFFVVNSSKIIAHILRMLRILYSHLSLRVHIRSIDL
jgi:hypothetical protein